MTMTKEEKEERKNTIEKLLNDGLSQKEIAEKIMVSEATVYRNMKKFGLKPNAKRQGFSVIGDKVLEDYKKGCSIGEIAEKYGRKESAVKGFIGGCKNKKTCLKELKNIKGLKQSSDLYKEKLKKIRDKMTVGRKINYEGKSYIVVSKYKRFVILQGKEYQITAMYADFMKPTGGRSQWLKRILWRL